MHFNRMSQKNTCQSRRGGGKAHNIGWSSIASTLLSDSPIEMEVTALGTARSISLISSLPYTVYRNAGRVATVCFLVGCVCCSHLVCQSSQIPLWSSGQSSFETIWKTRGCYSLVLQALPPYIQTYYWQRQQSLASLARAPRMQQTGPAQN